MYSSNIESANKGVYYTKRDKLEPHEFRKFYVKKSSDLIALQRFGNTWWSIARMHQYLSGQQQEAEAASPELKNINGYLRRIAKKHDDATREARAPKAPADTNEAHDTKTWNQHDRRPKADTYHDDKALASTEQTWSGSWTDHKAAWDDDWKSDRKNSWKDNSWTSTWGAKWETWGDQPASSNEPPPLETTGPS